MDWHKAKTILIVYFVIINIALLIYLIYSNFRTEGLRTQVAEQVVELLKNKNVDIDEKLLTENNYTNEMRYIYVSNVIKDYESFAKEALGEDAYSAEENRFETDAAYVNFEGDGFEIRTYDLPLIKTEINRSNAQKCARDYLEDLGMDMKDSNASVTDTPEGYDVTFYEYIGDFEIFGAKVNVRMKSDGIYAVYGNWYNQKGKDNNKSSIKDIPGMLIEYLNSKNGEELPDKILNIRLGYSTFETDDFHESLLLTPVWEITDDKNNVVYIDARETV